MELTTELTKRAAACTDAKQLLALAKEAGVALTGEAAQAWMARRGPAAGELSDEELENVAGGGCSHVMPCPQCGSTNTTVAGTQDYPMIDCHNCGYSNRSSIV